MSDFIMTEEHGKALILRINRPEKRNALLPEMYQTLASEIYRFENDDSLRVFILLGHDEIFTAGNDISDFLNAPLNEPRPAVEFLTAISTAKKPVIAGVRGPAIGIGTTMLLHCDLVFASEDSLFQMPFVQLGLVPEAASSLLLPRLIGHQRAAELFMLGRTFDAGEAFAMGLVNEVTAPERLQTVAFERADMLAQMAPEAVRQAKALLKSPSESVADRMDREFRIVVQRIASSEAQEAFTAFLDKRPADFSKFD